MSPSKIYGLIGYPVKHSLSPAMHNAAFKELNIDAEYRLFEIAPGELEEFLLNPDKIVRDTSGRTIRAGDVRGFNITIPHKVKAREILQTRFPLIEGEVTRQDLYYVKLTGAINTVKRTVPGLIYWNTDVYGLHGALEIDLGCEIKNKQVLVVGCGGAGRAVIAALSWKDYRAGKIYIYDLNPEAVNSLKEHFSELPRDYRENLEERIEFISCEEIPEKIKYCSLLINASPVGMKQDDSSLIDKNLLHQGLFIYDVVYNRNTQLIRDAKQLGIPAAGGLGMLLYQGVAALERWIQERAPVEEMKSALREEVSKL